MVRSVEEILKQEFGKSLSDSGVHILDPFAKGRMIFAATYCL
jgi:predicted helicase